MMGVIANTAAVLIGGGIGLLCKKAFRTELPTL